jgi:hypothetical protein
MGAMWALLIAVTTGCGGPRPHAPAGAEPDTVREEVGMARVPLADVLARHTQDLLAVPGVNGTGEGQESGEPVLIVFVVEDTPELRATLPRTIEGYRVVLRATGTVRARAR